MATCDNMNRTYKAQKTQIAITAVGRRRKEKRKYREVNQC